MSSEIRRFDGQVGIVTGGAKGIGRAVTLRLASEGASICIFDNDEKAIAELCDEGQKSNLKIEGACVDITDEQGVKAAIDRVATKHSQLDLVVNSAGIVGPNSLKTGDVSLADFQKTINVNLIGSFLITKHSITHMLKKQYGRIALIASVAGKEGNPNMVCYSASKGGVIAMTRSVAKEYAQAGITINAVCPATILTPMVAAMDPKTVEYMKSKIPMGRFGTLEEISALIAFYVSPEASFVTGQAIDHTGGRAVS